MEKHSIMVVDDSRIIHLEMKKMLAGSEFEITACCRSGEEAVEKYEQVQPDLVTMDIVMPGMDGVEACKKIKARWPEAQIYMVSSMAYDETIDQAVAAGAKGFLFKPFSQESLLEGLRGAIKAAEAK